VTDLTPYQTVTLVFQRVTLVQFARVIVRSAIRIGRLLPEALKFIENNQVALQQKSFSVFVACMTMMKEDEESRKTGSPYLDPVRALVKPANEGLFAGVIDPSKVSLTDKLAIKAVKAPIGDFRKWEQIDAWALNRL